MTAAPSAFGPLKLLGPWEIATTSQGAPPGSTDPAPNCAARWFRRRGSADAWTRWDGTPVALRKALALMDPPEGTTTTPWRLDLDGAPREVWLLGWLRSLADEPEEWWSPLWRDAGGGWCWRFDKVPVPTAACVAAWAPGPSGPGLENAVALRAGLSVGRAIAAIYEPRPPEAVP